MRVPHALILLATLSGVALGGPSPAGAQGPVACNSNSDIPNYSYTEVFDAADVPSIRPIAPKMNDLGDVAILVPFGDQSGLNAPRCVARHTGITTQIVLCSQSVDPSSDVNRIEDAPLDINNRGAIAFTGGRVGSGAFRFVVVPRSGPHVFVDEEGFVPELTDAGNLAFGAPATGKLMGYRPQLGDFVEIAAAGTYEEQLTSASGGGVLYFSGGNRIGRIRDAFTGTPILESDDAPGIAGPVDRSGGFAHAAFGFHGISRRLGLFGNDVTVIDFTDPTAPLLSFPGFVKLGCSVALMGTARGICRGGTRDREFCDPFPPGGGNECAPTGGFCQNGVGGLFRWQGGPIVPLLLEGDALFGSTVESFTVSSFLAPGFVEGNLAGQILFSVALADGRDLLVRGDPAGASASAPAGPSSCAGPACTFTAQPSGFTGLGPAGVPIYVSFGGLPSPVGRSAHEALALTGFDYAAAPGAPRFASVQIPFPLPNGQEEFLLEVGAASFPIVNGEQFDLTSIDPTGVAGFSIRGFDTSGSIDPAEVVSGFTFVTEAPAELTVTAVVPEAGAVAAGTAALLALAMLARRHGQARAADWPCTTTCSRTTAAADAASGASHRGERAPRASAPRSQPR